MGLSNTATPKYYGQFKAAVLRGEIPICREIEMEMNRIDALIRNPNVWYDPDATEGFIRYCEAELTLTNGDDLRLLPTFKLWAESILAWYIFETRPVYVPGPENHGGKYVNKTFKKRLINKQYLIVARGAAKSLYESCLQSYFLNVDTKTTHQITTAPTMKQAEEIMQPIRTSITRSRGPLFKFLTAGSLQNTTGNRLLRQKLVPTKKGIENFMTNSLLEVRPMSVDKLQGLRTKVNTIDEWLSGDLREDVVGAIEQGASKEPDWLIVAVSSEGTVRNGSGDTIKMELQKILKGEYIDPHTSIWHYKLDDVKEVANPKMWIKAQPNLNHTVTYDTYHRDVERSINVPSQRNDILAKRFGLPMEGTTFFFTFDEIQRQRRQEYWGLNCSLGADLSQGGDFCAFTLLFPLRGGAFGVKTRSYISTLTLMKLPGGLRQKYEEFIEEGTLHILEGAVLDMNEVYDDLFAWIRKKQYNNLCLGYDPYNAKKFVERYTAEHSEFGVEMVRQGVKTETVPLTEMKKMVGAKLFVWDESIMQWTMGNAVVQVDTNGGMKLMKRRNEEKIDNVSAWMNAWVAYKENKEMFE